MTLESGNHWVNLAKDNEVKIQLAVIRMKSANVPKLIDSIKAKYHLSVKAEKVTGHVVYWKIFSCVAQSDNFILIVQEYIMGYMCCYHDYNLME